MNKLNMVDDCNELSQYMPAICEWLQTNQEDLKIHYDNSPCALHEYHAYRDYIVKSIGKNGLPIIQTSRHSFSDGFCNRWFHGAILYKCVELDIYYVCVSIIHDNERMFFIICKSGQQFKLFRYFQSRRYKTKYDKNFILNSDIESDIASNTVNLIPHYSYLRKNNLKLSKGLIFIGSPGNGKTLLCKYIKNCFEKNALLCTTIHRNTQNIRKEIGRNSLIIFDDIDIDLLNRSKNAAGCCDLLSVLDGVEDKPTLRIYIFTTNESIDNIDDAFFRPGRIDKVIEFKKPDIALRTKFINSWDICKLNVSDIVNRTEGWSFAEMNAIRNNLLIQKLDKIFDVDKAINDVCFYRNDTQQALGFV